MTLQPPSPERPAKAWLPYALYILGALFALALAACAVLLLRRKF